MVTFKRNRKRNFQNPAEKYALYGLAGVFTLMLVLMIVGFSGRSRLNGQLMEAREIMAASIQSDMNKALQSYDSIDRKSADLAGTILPTMRQHMYAANSMNRVLTETFGEAYSMIDPTLYQSFEGIMAEYDRLMAAGQSTAAARESLGACMTDIEVALGNRFGADGLLLPQTASR